MNTINSLPYHYSEESFKENEQTKIVLDWIDKDKKVLEFGCHSGLLTKLLVEQKSCVVDGIELNQIALEKALLWLNNGYVADIEDIDSWENMLNNTKYDYILFLHVLEHLRNPTEVLIKALKFLKKDGIIIIGLPNISNVKDRLKISLGRFEYEDSGVMDRTHIKMFNYFTALDLIKNTNLKVIDYKTPYRINPLKYLISRIRFIWRISKLMSNNTILFKNKPNITDQIMLFKCNQI